jgi:hypothetical protein
MECELNASFSIFKVS